MMIELHAEECKSNDRALSEPDSGRRSIVASDRRTQEDEDDIPQGCRPEDIKSKWLSYPGLSDIYSSITNDLIITRLFGEKEERLVHDVFIHKLAKEYPEFLKSHQVRKIVFG
jgi:hypothetical protein